MEPSQVKVWVWPAYSVSVTSQGLQIKFDSNRGSKIDSFKYGAPMFSSMPQSDFPPLRPTGQALLGRLGHDNSGYSQILAIVRFCLLRQLRERVLVLDLL